MSKKKKERFNELRKDIIDEFDDNESYNEFLKEYSSEWIKDNQDVKVMKRNGDLVEYDGNKIIYVIKKAMSEGQKGIDESIANDIENDIHEEVLNKFHNFIFRIEDIQDMVEDGLMRYGRYGVAKRYILYRDEHNRNREEKWEMTNLQYDIWSQKYEFENEGFEGFLTRISNGNDNVKKLIRERKFLFGGRILANRGLQHKGRKITLSNCYVLSPPEDNLESIFETSSHLARTFSYGGGCGFHIGKLRPSGSKVNNSALTTSGSTSFMDLFSKVTEIIGQRGRRKII